MLSNLLNITQKNENQFMLCFLLIELREKESDMLPEYPKTTNNFDFQIYVEAKQ